MFRRISPPKIEALAGHFLGKNWHTPQIDGVIESIIGKRSGEAFQGRCYVGFTGATIDLSLVPGTVTAKANWSKSGGVVDSNSLNYNQYKTNASGQINLTVNASKQLIIPVGDKVHGITVLSNGAEYDFINAEEGDFLIAYGKLTGNSYPILGVDSEDFHTTDDDVPYSYLNEEGYSTYSPQPFQINYPWTDLGNGAFQYDGTTGDGTSKSMLWDTDIFTVGQEYTIEIEVESYTTNGGNWMAIDLRESGTGILGVYYDTRFNTPIPGEKKSITFTYNGGASLGLYGSNISNDEIITIKNLTLSSKYIVPARNGNLDAKGNALELAGKVRLKLNLNQSYCLEGNGLWSFDAGQTVTSLKVGEQDILSDVVLSDGASTNSVITPNSGVQLYDLTINNSTHYPCANNQLFIQDDLGNNQLTITGGSLNDVVGFQNNYHWNAVKWIWQSSIDGTYALYKVNNDYVQFYGLEKTRMLPTSIESQIKYPNTPEIVASGNTPGLFTIQDFINQNVSNSYAEIKDGRIGNILTYNLVLSNESQIRAEYFTKSN